MRLSRKLKFLAKGDRLGDRSLSVDQNSDLGFIDTGRVLKVTIWAR
jgi:hypothetical protein